MKGVMVAVVAELWFSGCVMIVHNVNTWMNVAL